MISAAVEGSSGESIVLVLSYSIGTDALSSRSDNLTQHKKTHDKVGRNSAKAALAKGLQASRGGY